MIKLTQQQILTMLNEGCSKIGQRYPKGYNCQTFVHDLYKMVGIKDDYRNFPRIFPEDIYENEFVGYPCFLKHKKHGHDKRFTHIGIIAPGQQLLHYSRYFGEPNVREVFLTHFTEIFKVYDFVTPKF